MKKLLFFLFCICMFTFRVNAESRYVDVGETFTVHASSKAYTQSVLWSWDYSILELQGSLSGISSTASFKALKKTPLCGSEIQAITYYYKNGTTSSGINKTVDTWTVHVSDDSNGGGNNGSDVSMHMSSFNMIVGQVTNIMAHASDESYSGNYKWTSSDQNVLSIRSQRGPVVTVKGISDGTSYLRVTLDNGSYDEVPIHVMSNEEDTNLDIFKFTLNDDGSGYIISATDRSKIPDHIEIPAYYNNLPVTEIGEYAFCCCSSLTSITIPNSVTVIGCGAFSDCSKLESITLSDSLECIKYDLFYNCTSLKALVLPGSIRYIEQYYQPEDESIRQFNTFYKCENLKNLSILNSKESLSVGYYNKPNENYQPSSWDSWKSWIETLFIDRSLEEDIYIPSIKKLELGESIEKVQVMHLKFMVDLDTIVSHALVPPVLEPLYDAKYMNINVYVPEEALKAYKADPVWGNFWNLQAAGVNDIKAESNTVSEIGRYDINGRSVSEDYSGFVIVRFSDGSCRKLIQK